MATLTKHTLSYGLSGRGVPVTAIAVGSANPLHKSGTGVTNFDEVWLYGSNNTASSIDVTLVWGLSASGDLSDAGLGNADKIVIQFNPKTRTTVTNGRLLQNGLSACAYVDSGTGNDITIDGYVNRIVV